jgi:hypothetical protein
VNALLIPHIAAGIAAIGLGAVAGSAPKGGKLHKAAGLGFLGAMLGLGITASLLSILLEGKAGAGGFITCYLVGTGWLAARRRDRWTGRLELGACLFILALAAASVAGGIAAAASPDGLHAGSTARDSFGGAIFCGLLGAADLKYIRQDRMAARPRLTRHLWRMCAAFFVATGSFFIGQQDVLPAAIRMSPLLFALGLAPLGLMAFWLVRMRLPSRPLPGRGTVRSAVEG